VWRQILHANVTFPSKAVLAPYDWKRNVQQQNCKCQQLDSSSPISMHYPIASAIGQHMASDSPALVWAAGVAALVMSS
jgi:hypothetical protein